MGQQGHGGGISVGVAQPAQALGTAHSVAAAAPTDLTVPVPIDGAIHVDTANNKIWVRVGGTWKGVGVS